MVEQGLNPGDLAPDSRHLTLVTLPFQYMEEVLKQEGKLNREPKMGVPPRG